MRISKTRSTKVIKASGAVTTTSQSGLFDEGTGEDLAVMLDVTAVSGTTPSLTVSVQWSNDGSTWFTADPADAFTAITAATKVTKAFAIKGLYARLNYLVSGTTPSFTFSAHSIIGD
jgi:hypothetical protein